MFFDPVSINEYFLPAHGVSVLLIGVWLNSRG
jgi:hypothetical protein